MALIADIKTDTLQMTGAVLYVLCHDDRTPPDDDGKRGWRIEYRVTVERQRPCTADNRSLQNEWLQRPEVKARVESMVAAAEKKAGAPVANRLALQDWLARPETRAEFAAFADDVRANRKEYYRLPLPELNGWFECSFGDGNFVRAAYKHLALRPELSNVREV